MDEDLARRLQADAERLTTTRFRESAIRLIVLAGQGRTDASDGYSILAVDGGKWVLWVEYTTRTAADKWAKVLRELGLQAIHVEGVTHYDKTATLNLVLR